MISHRAIIFFVPFVSKAISSITENIEKNIKNEEQYTNEKKQDVNCFKNIGTFFKNFNS